MKKLNQLKYHHEELLTESLSADNIHALMKMPVPGYQGQETLIRKFTMDAHGVQDLVNNVKVLQTNKIVKGAGAGRYGITYVLDNDHILKFFEGAHNNSSDNELSKFKDIQQRQFDGTSHRGEPAVYDLGKAPADGVWIYYLELGKVIPFEIWMETTRQDKDAWKEVLSVADQFFISFNNRSWI